MYGVIYLVSNVNNNKRYVGLTTRSVNKRFEEHCVANSYLGKAIRKHGRDNFRIVVIDTAENHLELCEKEIHYIKKYKTFGAGGYNLTNGGDGTNQLKTIVVSLNEKQKKFVDWVNLKNKEEPDVFDDSKMILLVMVNVMMLFLTAENERDKKECAKLLAKLEPTLFEYMLSVSVIGKEEITKFI